MAEGGLRTIIVTAGDTKVMPSLQGLIRSLGAFPQRQDVEIGCLDLGQNDADHAWLIGQGVLLVEPMTHLGVPNSCLSPYERASVARPFLREYFPGRDIYIWVDSDVWLQGWWVMEAYQKGALESGLAIAHERERGYVFQAWLIAWFAKHLILGYGPLDGAWLLSRPHLNAGLFAMHRDSPHWDLWVQYYQAAWNRTGKFNPHDQFSMNRLVHGGVLRRPTVGATVLLPRTTGFATGACRCGTTPRACCASPTPHTAPSAPSTSQDPAKLQSITSAAPGGAVSRQSCCKGSDPWTSWRRRKSCVVHMHNDHTYLECSEKRSDDRIV
jgi:hypothetical protein